MNQEVKELWVAALRSGDYAQGKNLLHEEQTDENPDQYCCLGVLCAIAVKNGVIPPPKKNGADEDRKWFAYGTEDERNSAFLPRAVQEWSGMESDNGEFWSDVLDRDSLVRLNDDGIPFTDIATVIEEQF